MVLACSHSRSLQSLARLDARIEFENFGALAKGGVEADRAHHCRPYYIFNSYLSYSKIYYM